MFCIDWNDDDPLLLEGNEWGSTDEWTSIELLLNPCNYIHTMQDYKEDFISPECIPDLDK